MATTSAAGSSSSTSGEAPRDQYALGHSDAVLRSHKWRTVDNSAAYALPALREVFAAASAGAGDSTSSPATMLDIGCGPGTMTVGFSALAAPTGGRVVGVDFAASVLEGATKLAAERGVAANTTFEQGNIFALRFPDASFVAAHAHQVLMHLADPVAALKELRRVLKPAGSVLALREGDFGATAVFPDSSGLQLWKQLWAKVAHAAGNEPDAGRRVKSWALAAGFAEQQMTLTAGTFCYSTPAERAWWGELWADRSVRSDSAFVQEALAGGHATQQELEQVAAAWREWSRTEGATFIMPQGELLVRL